MSYAEYRYSTEYSEEEDSPTAVGSSVFNDDAELTIIVDKDQSDLDLSADKNSDYDGTYIHNNNIQPQQVHCSYQKQQHQYPPNHYGYDVQQKEKQITAEEPPVDNSDVGDNDPPIENISEAISAPLTYLPQPSLAATVEHFQQERQLHHRAIVATDSAVSLTGDDILASPCSTNLKKRSGSMKSTFSSSSISQSYPRQTKSRSGSLSSAGMSAGPRSTSLGAITKGYDIPVPPIPSQHQHQQHQQHSTPSGRGILVNINAQPSSTELVLSNPPSPRKTGWERETPTTPTPQLHKGQTSHHQHSSSLFDFFRTRKQSVTKNSAAHHTAIASANASATATPPLPTNLPLMGIPPTIAKSRMGPPRQYPPYTPVPPLLRKQSLDISALSEYQTSSSSTFGSPLTKNDRHAATMPILPSTVMTPSSSVSSFTSPYIHSPHTPSSNTNLSHHSSLTNTAHSALSKVAAVVGATVGKSRSSVTAEALELGQGPSDHTQAYEPSSLSQTRQGLSPTQLTNHAKFLQEAKTTQELTEYIDKLYHTILNQNVALEHANKQVSALQKELDQTRYCADEDKKGLVAEADRFKEQIVTMEENFLLWRTKVHNDQMAQQKDYLHERLIRHDRIEELEDDLNTSQEEVARLRRRLLVLEYEDGYIGPTSLLNDDPSEPIVPENGPMTVATHKRRSADFKILAMKAQNYEHQIQGLVRALETERQGHQKDLVEFRMRMHTKVVKLEEEVQAAKMESSIYTEMMHEIVTENDTLRTKVKHAWRKSRIGGGGSTSFDYYGYSGFDASGDSIYGSDDEMEEIAIS
ncbi:MAG: hypothetical protein BYD32DRAFT_460757 [Podila humilis]|nr:MAG: hypothetical protein BYD32DRAFT_460757 [Podila humilis]